MKTYAANALNQYKSIANPDAVGLRGSATNTATVTVNGNAVTRDNVASDVRPWHFALPAANANGPEYTFASIVGAVNPPGTNEADIVSTTSGSVYASPQNETLTYDDDGNLLSDGRFTYTWNGENRLICAEEQVCPTNRTLRKVDYAYDHQGRMVWKEIKHRDAEAQSWEEEKATSYLWDGYNIIAEKTVADSATNTTYNIWGLDLDGTMQGAGGVGGLLAVISPLPLGEGQGEGSSVYLPCYDANGNVMEYVAADGSIAAHREYDPFGGTVVATGNADAFMHWFSTKPWCSITGLSEYQYRKYSPDMGRWLNRDPIEEEGGNNLYLTLNNNLMLFYDFLGLEARSDCGPWKRTFTTRWLDTDQKRMVFRGLKSLEILKLFEKSGMTSGWPTVYVGWLERMSEQERMYKRKCDCEPKKEFEWRKTGKTRWKAIPGSGDFYIEGDEPGVMQPLGSPETYSC